MFRRSIHVLLLAAVAAPAQSPPDKYKPVVAALDEFVRREVADKKLPALSVAIVDDQQLVWSAGFGMRDPKAGAKADANTVYCVGSVSKLFTDLAVMRLAERGELNIDAPVTDYLPDFKPENPFNETITLRHLMTHRAGLVREPPVGNYFDPTEPTLADTVASLNSTKLVLKPGTKTKYSNAGIAVVGRVLEARTGKPFAEAVRDEVLRPIGMTHSAFNLMPEQKPAAAQAIMWTSFGREFPAPTFRLGIAPAGSLMADVNDMARFLSVLFAGGKPVVKPETLESMYKPQYTAAGARSGFGLGFIVSEFEGRRRVGHDGAVYGCATECAALPDDKLGVVAITSCDFANAVTKRVADEGLRLMLAAKAGRPLPTTAMADRLAPEEARKLAGHYTAGPRVIDLAERDGRLTALLRRGGVEVELKRRDPGTLIVDDRLAYGPTLTLTSGGFRMGNDEYRRADVPKPAACPNKWLGLIGEYGWDHNTLFVLERDGRLHAQIEWHYLYPLTEESENVYRFPDFGLYHDEKIVFTRDANGKATKAVAASVPFLRRPIDGEDGRTFRITPERPVVELRKEALAAKPPATRGEFAKPDLVELVTLDPTIKLDIRYASDNNFLGVPLYTSAKAFLQRPAAEALARAHKKLGEQGYGLLIHDGYRPWSVTKIFWDATPPKHHIFVADPSTGSRHNRGCAVDLTLYDKATGQPIRMVGGYDEFSDRSFPNYPGGTSWQRWHRELLRHAMEAEGFTVYEAEWWHFDYRDWKKYPLGNTPFEEMTGNTAPGKIPA
ncbi:MAG: serine hydrolase [Gemmataceae bacterium]